MIKKLKNNQIIYYILLNAYSGKDEIIIGKVKEKLIYNLINSKHEDEIIIHDIYNRKQMFLTKKQAEIKLAKLNKRNKRSDIKYLKDRIKYFQKELDKLI